MPELDEIRAEPLKMLDSKLMNELVAMTNNLESRIGPLSRHEIPTSAKLQVDLDSYIADDGDIFLFNDLIPIKIKRSLDVSSD